LTLGIKKILSSDTKRKISYQRNQESNELETISQFYNISLAKANGYPEPIISGSYKKINDKKFYHRTSKKAFNVFCATKQRKKQLTQKENHRKYLLRKIDDTLYNAKNKWTERKK